MLDRPSPQQATLLSVVVAPRVAADFAQAALETLASDDPIAAARRMDAALRGLGANATGGPDAMDDDGAPPDPGRPVTPAQTRAAAAVAMAAAAARAKQMADQQQQEMEQLTRHVIKLQMERVKLKTHHVEQIQQVRNASCGAARAIQLMSAARAAASPR